MGLISIADGDPTPSGVVDGSNNSLASAVDMDMLNSHCLFAAPPQFAQSFHLHRERAGQLDRQIAR
jgi:hypothetical protein